MSDIHILSGDGKGHWLAVFHFPVPNQNNAVSVNYRTALVNSGLGGSSVMVEGVGAGQISTAELAQVQSGEVFEYTRSILAESGGTSAPDQRTMVRAEYARLETEIIDRMKNRLKYFGHTESKS